VITRRVATSFALILLAAASGLSGEVTFDLSADSAIAEGDFSPSLAWGMTANAQRIGDDKPSLYLDLAADLSKNFLDKEYSGSVDLTLSAFRLIGRTNLGLKLETAGILPSPSTDGSAVAALSLPVTLNGSAISYSIAPKLGIDPSESGYLSFGLSNSVSFMVGTLILKPGLGVSIIRAWSEGTAYALKPGIDISWYPGFPLSLALTAEYLTSTDEAASDTLGFKCTSIAAPTDRILLTSKAYADFLSSPMDAAVSLETAFSLHREESGKDLSLPISFGWQIADGLQTYSLGLGLRYQF
jgi:hypothetical protein